MTRAGSITLSTTALLVGLAGGSLLTGTLRSAPPVATRSDTRNPVARPFIVRDGGTARISGLASGQYVVVIKPMGPIGRAASPVPARSPGADALAFAVNADEQMVLFPISTALTCGYGDCVPCLPTAECVVPPPPGPGPGGAGVAMTWRFGGMIAGR